MKLTTRVLNWDWALVRWARGLLGAPFDWGETDCGSLVRGAIISMYAVDPLGGGGWGSLRGARTELRERGGLEAALQELGAVPFPIAFAQAGDVILGPGPDEQGLPQALIALPGGVVLRTAVLHGVDTVHLAALHREAVCWRCPHG